MHYVSATEGLSPLIRTRVVLIWDSLTGSVRAPVCAKCPPALQPGLDDVDAPASGRAPRTLASITAAALAMLREGGGGAQQHSAMEANNNSLLRGTSLQHILSPALPCAIVL